MKSRNLRIYLLILVLITIGLSSDVRMVCAEGKMNITFIKYNVINDSVTYENVSTIDLDLLAEKLNKSGPNVNSIKIFRGPDYVEFNYTPLYNFGPYNYVKTAISNGNLTLRFRIYYDGTAQICAISDKLFKDGSLSRGYITDVLLLAPLKKCSIAVDSDGPWPYYYSSCPMKDWLVDLQVDKNIVYLQWILKEAVDYTNFHLYDVFLKEYQDYKNNLLNITDSYIYSYNLSIDPVNSYITGFGDWYLTTLYGYWFVHVYTKSGLKCTSINPYIAKVGNFWADDIRTIKIFINGYFSGRQVKSYALPYTYTATTFLARNKNTFEGISSTTLNVYYSSFLIKSKYWYVNCTPYGGWKWVIQKKFASGYGTGRAIKELSSPVSTPGRPINVTVYVDPPRAKYVEITDYVPKVFGWNKTIIIERRKLGNETPIQTQTLTVRLKSDGDYWVYTLNGQTLNILQNLSNNEYIEIKYQLITPTTNVQSQYNIKGVDVVYAPQL